MTWLELALWVAVGLVIMGGVQVLAKAAARSSYDWWEQQYYGPRGRSGEGE